MRTWRFYAFNDVRLDDVLEPACRPGHVVGNFFAAVLAKAVGYLAR